jgi:1-acyl-sn-glycerol-3-phosphate acyltransferase
MKFIRPPGRTDPVPPTAQAYGVDNGRRIGIVLGKLVYRMKLVGTARIPPTGPVLFVINHSAALDGPVLFGVLPRRVSFLVKAEMFTGPLGWLLTAVGQYGLHREIPDRAPLLNALAQLKAGGTIGIFPEGTRGHGAVDSVFNGAGWLACRSGASIVPVAMRGTLRPVGGSRRFRPRVDVLIGESFTVPAGAGRKAVAAATELIHEKLKTLVDELDQRRS